MPLLIPNKTIKHDTDIILVANIVGEGVFSEVYLVKNIVLDCWETWKLTKEPLENEGVLKRFLGEAKILRQLQGTPGILWLYRAQPILVRGKEYGCIATEVINAKTIATSVRAFSDERKETELFEPIDFSLELVLAVCKSLSAAHEVGIAHKDIKPENILGRCQKKTNSGENHWQFWLIDFGFSTGTAIIREGDYAPPETRNATVPENYNPQCGDIWALGSLFYRLLTNNPPKLDNKGMFPSPSKLNKKVNRQLDAIVLKMLSADPAQRPQNATVLLPALETIRNDWRRRPLKEKLQATQPAMLLLLGTVVVLLSLLLYFHDDWRQKGDERKISSALEGFTGNEKIQSVSLLRRQLEFSYGVPDYYHNAAVAVFPISREKPFMEKNWTIQVGYDADSDYHGENGRNFIASIVTDGEPILLSNNAVKSEKKNLLFMKDKGGYFEGEIPASCRVLGFFIAYGERCAYDDRINHDNKGSPRFNSLRILPSSHIPPNLPQESAGIAPSQQSTQLFIQSPFRPDDKGCNYSCLVFLPQKDASQMDDAQTTRHTVRETSHPIAVAKGSTIRLKTASPYTNDPEKPRFLLRLETDDGLFTYFTNSAALARQRGRTGLMQYKNGAFEATFPRSSLVTQVVVDIGATTIFYGDGSWPLNPDNDATLDKPVVEVHLPPKVP